MEKNLLGRNIKFALLLGITSVIGSPSQAKHINIICPAVADIKVKEDGENLYIYHAQTTGKVIEIKSHPLENPFNLKKTLFYGIIPVKGTESFMCVYSTNESVGKNTILKLYGTHPDLEKCTLIPKKTRFPNIDDTYLKCKEHKISQN